MATVRRGRSLRALDATIFIWEPLTGQPTPFWRLVLPVRREQRQMQHWPHRLWPDWRPHWRH
jgi:hypothetical protein